MTPTGWAAVDIPSQAGRTVVVTGANSGIGLGAVHALAGAGAHVIMACRDTARGEAAAARLSGDVEVSALDLADLASVRSFAKGIAGPVDVLVNNAGVMAVPLQRTSDGFEMQLGTNHLGHFALTALLLDKITDRVVTVSSGVHYIGRIRLDDLNWEHHPYQRWLAYAQAKLANLMFAYELQHRFVAAGSRLRSMAAHPGYAATNLQAHTETFQDTVMGVLNRVIGQSADGGSLPTLYAATVTDLPGGSYIGPSGIGELRGTPRPVGSSAASHDRDVQRQLWAASEKLTDVRFDLDGAPT